MEFLDALDVRDLEPLVDLSEQHQAASIDYSHEYKLLLRYFVGLLQREERSERVLLITEQLLNINPAHYTVWEFRRQSLVALQKNLMAELDFVDAFTDGNPKNYQIWYHRRALALLIGPVAADREKEFTELVFDEDAKNYHAWAHRQSIVSAFSSWEGELELAERFIAADLRNNSAWNHVRRAPHLRRLDHSSPFLTCLCFQLVLTIRLEVVCCFREIEWSPSL